MLTTKRSQRTLASATEVRGVGFFHGSDVTLRFNPAEPDTGVVFVRSDLPDRPTVPARIGHVVPALRRTTIQRGSAQIEMIEHVMAALAGSRIDNCLIEVDAPECPGCDGSSRVFVEAFEQAGAIEQDRPRQALAIERSFTVREGNATLAAHPGSGDSLTLSYHLDYGPDSAIGPQSYLIDLTPPAFRRELAGSRTFLLESEVQALRAAGIGTRATPADVLIFGRDGVVGNKLRFADECARHKVLDMVGDLSLLGMDLHGFVVAHRSGHAAPGRRHNRYPGYPRYSPPPLSALAHRPRARDSSRQDDRGDQECERQRAVLPGALAGTADHAGRPHHRGDGPGRGRPGRGDHGPFRAGGDARIGGRGQAAPAGGSRRSAPPGDQRGTTQAKLGLRLRHCQGGRRRGRRGQDPVRPRRRSSRRVRSSWPR